MNVIPLNLNNMKPINTSIYHKLYAKSHDKIIYASSTEVHNKIFGGIYVNANPITLNVYFSIKRQIQQYYIRQARKNATY